MPLALPLFVAALSLQSTTQATQQQEQQRQQQEQQQQQQQDRRYDLNRPPLYATPPIYRIEGKVLMAGGGPPPDLVAIQCLCDGSPAARTTANAKGLFSLQLGGGISSSNSDATFGRRDNNLPDGGSLTPHTVSTNDCELRAVLSGFRSEPYRLGNLQAGASVAQAVLILTPIENVSGYTFSGTSLNAPKAAVKVYEKGTEAFRKNKSKEAERHLRTAVDLYPKYAVAWYELGRVLLKQEDRAEAGKALLAAAAADPKYISPYPLLAQLALDAQQWEELAKHTATVIRLNPFFAADIYVLSAQANLVLERLDIAELHAKEAVRMDTKFQYTVASRLLARIMVKQGRTQEAIAYLRSYSKLLPPGSKELDAVQNEIAAVEQAAK